MLVTFGATFAGVFASFILWCVSRFTIRYFQNKKAAKQLLKDIEYEMYYNIASLNAVINSTIKSLEEMSTIPSFIPRMCLDVYQFSVSSGDIRLLQNIKTKRLIRYVAAECGMFNRFASTAEIWLAVYVLRNDPQSLSGSVNCLNGLIDNAKMTRERLVHSLDELYKDKPTILVQRGEITEAQPL